MTHRMTIGICLAAALAVGCGRGPAAPGQDVEPPTLDVTHWTDRSELFMEYPPLAAGEPALFAVHLTDLRDFSAMTAGRPRIEFTPEPDGPPVVLHGEEPSRPGVFRVQGRLPAAGRYRWALVVDAPGISDRHDLGTVMVFPDRESAMADAEARPKPDPTTITYLKEPQWSNGFATQPVSESDIRRPVRAPAVIEPLTGGEAIVSAPADGRFLSGRLPAVGTRVTAGQELGHLQPRLAEAGNDRSALAAAVVEAELALEAARAELGRSERLLAERAVPRRRVEEAQRAVKAAEARLAAARARLAQRDETLTTGGGAAGGNAFVLRAPISGVVAEVFAALGASYEEGAPLFRIVRTDAVELQVHVPAADGLPGSVVEEIALEIPGRPDPLVVKPTHMHYAGVLDPRTKALPIQFDVDNHAGQLLIGQPVTAVLYTARRERMMTIPKDAVLMEAGRPYVFVQVGGERFLRRYIEIAVRDGDRIGVRSGIAPGERVVTRGAYDVQLASAASALPAESHVH